MNVKSEFYEGAVFNKLTLLKEVSPHKWICKCVCGNTKEVLESRLKSACMFMSCTDN